MILGPMEFVTKSDEELEDMKALEQLLLKDGIPVPILYSELKEIPLDQLRLFAHFGAIYQFPTIELINWLRQFINGRDAIEIGAGNGCIGRAVGIPITDNRMQEWDHIKAYYRALTQPTIIYGEDIENLDALSAIERYRPSVVVACWVTQLKKPNTENGNMHGVDELELLKHVDHYVLVGNENIHSTKEIMLKVPSTHNLEIYKFDWLVSRQIDQKMNRIYVWSRK